MKHWKRYMALLLALVMVLTLAACGEADSDETEDLTLRLAYVGAPKILDPAMATADLDRTLIGHLYENLMKPTASGAVAGMARTYTCTDNLDGTETYTFTLREGAAWSDGTPVTAQDFVRAWQRLVSPELQSPNAKILSVVAGYEQVLAGDAEALQVYAEDQSTLVVQLNCHCPYFLTGICTDPATMPVRQEAALSWADGVVLLGNGPYAIGTWQDDTAMTLTVSESYYDAKRLHLTKMEFFFAADAAEAMRLYESGEADFVMDAGSKDGAVPIARADSTYLIVNSMADNLRKEEVRQAMNLVIDRNALVAQQGETYAAADGLVPSGVHITGGEHQHFREVNGPLVDNDPEHYLSSCEQAQELMNAAGYSTDAAIARLGTVTLLCLNTPPQQRTAIQIQNTWQEQLGFTVVIVSVSQEDWQDALADGAFTVALITNAPKNSDAIEYLQSFATGKAENYGLYSATAYDMLMRTAAQSGSVEARDAYLEDAERLLVESGYVMPLFERQTTYLLRENYTGVFDNGLGQCYFTGVTQLVQD